ncbi:MAG: diaminopimelate epimerase [Desulfobacterales bacterium]|jgi:diaminopimelate epimerase|nr:diaminopimelate epimerase [Desulfobacterales bacterium]
MKSIPFYKMSGAGNDFIVIDNRSAVLPVMPLNEFAFLVCRRKLSVGADGLILVENSKAADFKWRFFNSDGSAAEMCGNGARCAARFACLNAITGPQMTFQTLAGLVSATVTGDRVRVKMPDPSGLVLYDTVTILEDSLPISRVNTGVPHVVVMISRLQEMDVVGLGRQIRFHPGFGSAGTNVNFVEPQVDGSIAIRTYERGVEDETLACGTGAIAAALVVSLKLGKQSPVKVITRSGVQLDIHFREAGGMFSEVHLEGDARIIYTGQMEADAWDS